MIEQIHHTRTEKLLLEAGRMFNNTIEYEALIEQVLCLVLTAVNAEAAFVFRVDHDRTDMKIRFMKASDCKMSVFTREVGDGVAGWVEKYREAIILNNAADHPRVDQEMASEGNIKARSLISVPLVGKGQMIGVIEAFNKIDGEFTSIDLDILMGLSNQIAVAIDNAHLYRMVRREALEKNLLYEIGKKLSGSLELDELLQEILELLKQVVDYDAVGVFLLDPSNGSIDSAVTVGYGKEEEPVIHLRLGQGLVGTVIATGQAVIVPDVTADPRYVKGREDTRSEMVVPIRANDKIIGGFNLESSRLSAYGKHDLELVEAFASQAAVSIERARLHRRLVTSQKLDQQLAIARDIQQSFLPECDPNIAGYSICGANIASEQVGGDYYDFIRIVEGQTGITIGDVSGKGIPAALIMASFRASLIAEIRNNYSIRTICRKVNSLLYESTNPETYVTAVYGVLDSKNHMFTFANCGHNPPFLLRADGSVEYLREGGPILGMTTESKYEERPLFLNKGDIIVLYTDGVTEVFDEKGKEFGLDNLIALVRQHQKESAPDIQRAILDTTRTFASQEHVFDDLTMVVIKRNG
ncbi:MAG: GAF domain-containing SpoIIE family protein phosphatase [Candidatus Zixiibacteriota bacterium]